MKFSGREIPGALFKLARDRMLAKTVFTPDDIRNHVMSHGREHLVVVSGIEANHRIIADRVFQEARRQLHEAGEVAPLKRGVWAKASFLQAASDAQPTKSSRVCA